MKLSTRSRYGLRFIYDLALHYGEGVILLKEISRRIEVSEKYLSNLAIPLKGAGLINAVRGAHGGYELIKPPDTVTVKEIYQLLEGDRFIIECIGDFKCCSQRSICPTREMWTGLQKNMFDFMEEITLRNLIDQNKKKNPGNVFMYHI